MGFQKKLVETLNKYGPKKTIFLPHFNEVLRETIRKWSRLTNKTNELSNLVNFFLVIKTTILGGVIKQC